MELLFLTVGLIIGVTAAWLVLKFKAQSQRGISNEELQQLKQDLVTSQDTLAKEQAQLGILEERNTGLKEQFEITKTELRDEKNQVLQLNTELGALRADYQNLEEKLRNQKEELSKLQEQFTTEFKNIANELLEDKSRKFTEQNKEQIGQLLGPLNEKIQQFEKKVEDTHKENLQTHAALKQQIVGLKELNLQMSQEAMNLTKALKGDTKAQGNWGEVILERILEKSGLTKDREYVIQESLKDTEGKTQRPDVVVKLPDEKNLIIDSKVSLTHYERFIGTEDEVEKAQFLKEHIQSVRSHMRLLSEKNYQNLYDIGGLDFVLMFIPIEPAFGLAFRHDPELYHEAFDRNIVVVSTSTLLATLKTIASIWRQEYQNRNAMEIAKRSGELYDKFEGLIKDLIDVGNRMDSSKRAYEDAMKKLYTGRGNLVKRVEDLKKLGAKASKSLPSQIVDRAGDFETEERASETLPEEKTQPAGKLVG